MGVGRPRGRRGTPGRVHSGFAPSVSGDRSLIAGLWDAAVDREHDTKARLGKAAKHWEATSDTLDDYEDEEDGDERAVTGRGPASAARSADRHDDRGGLRWLDRRRRQVPPGRHLRRG
jgi:hypothetical protein